MLTIIRLLTCLALSYLMFKITTKNLNEKQQPIRVRVDKDTDF